MTSSIYVDVEVHAHGYLCDEVANMYTLWLSNMLIKFIKLIEKSKLGEQSEYIPSLLSTYVFLDFIHIQVYYRGGRHGSHDN